MPCEQSAELCKFLQAKFELLKRSGQINLQAMKTAAQEVTITIQRGPTIAVRRSVCHSNFYFHFAFYEISTSDSAEQTCIFFHDIVRKKYLCVIVRMNERSHQSMACSRSSSQVAASKRTTPRPKLFFTLIISNCAPCQTNPFLTDAARCTETSQKGSYRLFGE